MSATPPAARSAPSTAVPAPDAFLVDGEPTHLTMFLLAHHGLRRDLSRFAQVFAGNGSDAAADLVAVREHWSLFREIIETHHRAEDDILFPSLRDARPDLAGALDALDAEHGQLEELLDAVEQGLTADLDHDPEPARTAISRLAAVLDSHLAAEERDLVPVMLELPAPAGPPPGGGFPPELAVPWSVDGVHPDVVAVLRASLPGADGTEADGWLDNWAERRLRTWGDIAVGAASRARVPELVGWLSAETDADARR